MSGTYKLAVTELTFIPGKGNVKRLIKAIQRQITPNDEDYLFMERIPRIRANYKEKAAFTLNTLKFSFTFENKITK